MTTELSATQQDIRTALEKIIERTRNSFFECGKALAQIRDDRLYRDTHDTFEKYCEEKWGWKRDYAYKLISASEIVASLPVNVSKSIQTESVARAVAKVPESDRKAVVKEAAKSGPVTAPAIKAAAVTVKAREEKPAEPVAIKCPVSGKTIPADVWIDWQRAEETGKELRSMMSKVKCHVKNAIEAKDTKDGDVIWAELNNTDIAHFEGGYFTLRQLIPYTLCPNCQGIKRKTCTLCKRRGFLSERLYPLVCSDPDFRKVWERGGKK